MREEMYRRAANGEGQVYSYRWATHSPKAIVQFIHDAGTHATWYENLAQALNVAGFDVYANDVIGHGMSRQGHQGAFGMKDGMFDCLVEDVDTLYRKAAECSGESLPKILIGIGFGVNIALSYAAKHEVDGLVLLGAMGQPKAMLPTLMTANQHIRRYGYNSVSESVHTMVLQLNRIAGAASANENFWISTDEDELNRYANDPDSGFMLAASAYREIIKQSRHFRKKKEIENIGNIPVLILSGAEDQLGECGEAPRMLSARLSETDHDQIDLKLYKSAYHDILHDTCKDKALRDIAGWLNQILSEE